MLDEGGLYGGDWPSMARNLNSMAIQLVYVYVFAKREKESTNFEVEQGLVWL